MALFMRIQFVIVLAVLACGTSFAGELFYIGANVGASVVDGIADADQVTGNPPPQPSNVSINGIPFHSDDTSWSGFVGWKLKRWLSLELGYTCSAPYGILVTRSCRPTRVSLRYGREVLYGTKPCPPVRRVVRPFPFH